MEYITVQNEELGFSFKLPEAATVLQILRYDSRRLEAGDAPAFIVLWECAKTVMSDWQCARLPNMNVNLETLDNAPDAALQVRIIEAVGITVSAWRRGLDTVSKN